MGHHDFDVVVFLHDLFIEIQLDTLWILSYNPSMRMNSNGQISLMVLLGRYVPALVGYARVAEPQGPDCWTAAGDTLALRRAARSLELKSEISSGFFLWKHDPTMTFLAWSIMYMWPINLFVKQIYCPYSLFL